MHELTPVRTKIFRRVLNRLLTFLPIQFLIEYRWRGLRIVKSREVRLEIFGYKLFRGRVYEDRNYDICGCFYPVFCSRLWSGPAVWNRRTAYTAICRTDIFCCQISNIWSLGIRFFLIFDVGRRYFVAWLLVALRQFQVYACFLGVFRFSWAVFPTEKQRKSKKNTK